MRASFFLFISFFTCFHVDAHETVRSCTVTCPETFSSESACTTTCIGGGKIDGGSSGGPTKTQVFVCKLENFGDEPFLSIDFNESKARAKAVSLCKNSVNSFFCKGEDWVSCSSSNVKVPL